MKTRETPKLVQCYVYGCLLNKSRAQLVNHLQLDQYLTKWMLTHNYHTDHKLDTHKLYVSNIYQNRMFNCNAFAVAVHASQCLCSLIKNTYLFFSYDLLLPPLLRHHLHPSPLIHYPPSQRSLHLQMYKAAFKKRLVAKCMESQKNQCYLPSSSFFFRSSISFWNWRSRASFGSSLILALFLMFLALLA